MNDGTDLYDEIDSYTGQIKIWPCPRCPAGWAWCTGDALKVAEYSALFSLIGTTYGGDGREWFRLPDLRTRVPIHMGHGPGLTNRVLGANGGASDVQLTRPIHDGVR